MDAIFAATPAFGQADLSNCEREQIHLAASVQPSGVLLVVREPDLEIVQASVNAAATLGLPSGPLGTRLDAIPGDLLVAIRPHLIESLAEHSVAVRARIGSAVFDVLLHRPPGGGLIVELEPAGPVVDLTPAVEKSLNEIVAAPSLRTLCDETVRLFRDLAGYDRVMVYRFDDAGHGEVVAEEREPRLESFLGNHYPATDIPQIARRLYERNRVRMLVDVGYVPSPLEPRESPLTGDDLDMSLCFLRSFSPIHVQYLRNMGVGATLVVSLLVEGSLWGLVACHHYSPRHVQFEIRTACELLAEAVATRIAALESFGQAQAEMSVRRLEHRMIEAISRKGDWRAALFDKSHAVTEPLRASGAALLFEGEVLTVGDVPGTAHLRQIAAWLQDRPPTPVYATNSLGSDIPRFAPLAPVASGIVAASVSETPGEYLFWFRPERVQTVTWGGNPFKPMLIGDDPRDLSPRRSFAQWHQVVEGTSEPWTRADLTAARLISDTVTDVVLQFRAVRTLIAQDQLEHVRRQVGLSDQPVVISGSDGRIIFVNDAFRRLQPPSAKPLEKLDDLIACFLEPTKVRRRMHDLLEHRRTWRGEIVVKPSGKKSASADGRPFLVRADPVFSSPDRVLGYVLLFTDLTERKAADAARRRFQEGIVGGNRLMAGKLDSDAHLLFQNLVSPVVENAQLAALEITEGMELARMPKMLESVQASVVRAAELLGQLIRRGRTKRLDS